MPAEHEGGKEFKSMTKELSTAEHSFPRVREAWDAHSKRHTHMPKLSVRFWIGTLSTGSPAACVISVHEGYNQLFLLQQNFMHCLRLAQRPCLLHPM